MVTVSLKNWLGSKDIEVPKLYLVGGTVRDLLLGSSPKDLDLVCKNAGSFARELAEKKNAALVAMEKKSDEPCYRVVDRNNSENYLDIAEMRGENIFEDLKQRDFTIDAIAIEMKEDGTIGEIIDPLKGAEDIERRVIKTVNERSIVSDPLRILRAVRLSALLDFIIDESTIGEMKKGAGLLENISAERITAELLLLLKTPRSSFYVRSMDEIGILDVIFPEIRAMKGCLCSGYQNMNIWQHSLLTLENTEDILNKLVYYFGDAGVRAKDFLDERDQMPLLKLSALLHDVSPRHDKEGARMIRLIAERLKMPCRSRDFMALMAEEHRYILYLASERLPLSVKMRWFRKMTDAAVPAIILSMADVMSIPVPDTTEKYREHHINWSKQSVRDYFGWIKTRLERPSFITGDDLAVLGIKSGPEMGRILAEVRNAQDTGLIKSRDEALALARKLMVNKV